MSDLSNGVSPVTRRHSRLLCSCESSNRSSDNLRCRAGRQVCARHAAGSVDRPGMVRGFSPKKRRGNEQWDQPPCRQVRRRFTATQVRTLFEAIVEIEFTLLGKAADGTSVRLAADESAGDRQRGCTKRKRGHCRRSGSIAAGLDGVFTAAWVCCDRFFRGRPGLGRCGLHRPDRISRQRGKWNAISVLLPR